MRQHMGLHPRLAAWTSSGDSPRLEVPADLALHTLERIVDRLAIATQALSDFLVRAAVEVQRQHARLKVGERCRDASYERAQTLGADDLIDRVMYDDPGIISSSVGSLSPDEPRRAREGEVLVKRRVLVTGRRLHGREIWRVMQSSAKLRKLDSRSVPVVTDRLVETRDPPE